MPSERLTSDLQPEEASEEQSVNLDAWMDSLDRLERMRRKNKPLYLSKSLREQRRIARGWCG